MNLYSYFEIILWFLLGYTIYIILFGGMPRKIKTIIENMGSGASGSSASGNSGSKNKAGSNKPGSKVIPFFPCMKTYKTMQTCNGDYRCHWKFNRCVRKHKNLCNCAKPKPGTTAKTSATSSSASSGATTTAAK